MFSADRLTDTVCGGYIAVLGVLSGDPKGLQMLDRWRMFNMMYHILDGKQRPDLIKLLLSSFDYSIPGHPRVLLNKALIGGEKDIRIYATNVLRKYANNPSVNSVSNSKWAIEALVQQLYDPEVEVCATAVKILEKACNTKNYLEYIVECRPALDHLGEIGAPLLLRFLSTSIGYHYLDGLDYISNEMDDWFLGRNDTYVKVVEASLARAFAEGQDEHANRMSILDDEPDPEVDPHVPPHFYRELTRTQEGCKLLKDKGHFSDFATTIRDHGMQYDDPEMTTKVKGCLWAVGNVGSMELGAPFLESCDVVEHIVKIAEEHEVMSLRGTAFFVLGLISRSMHGLEMLSEHGWDANTNSVGLSLGFCIPSNLTKFFSLEPWKHETVSSVTLPKTQRMESTIAPSIPSRARSESLLGTSMAPELDDENMPHVEEEPAVVLDADPLNQQILELFIDLSNTVRFSKARNDLIKLKQQKKPVGFTQPQMFRRVMALMESHHYRLNARRMLELFERNVLRQVVFEEDKEDDEEEEGDDHGGDEDGRVFDESASQAGGLVYNAMGINDQRVLDSLRRQEEEGELDEKASDSSGDEQRTERQRSVSNPSELGMPSSRRF